MDDRIDEKLNRLLNACLRPVISRSEIKQTLEEVLIWLTEHNTDANCRRVDIYISTHLDLAAKDRLPTDIAEILFDMGGALHDTHTSPDVARNFWSTPDQLLERTRQLPD